MNDSRKGQTARESRSLPVPGSFSWPHSCVEMKEGAFSWDRMKPRVVNLSSCCQLATFLLLYSSSLVRDHLSGTRGCFLFPPVHSHCSERPLGLVIGAFLDKIKTDTLMRRESHGIWVLDGFQAELGTPSHPMMKCIANCPSKSLARLCFLSSCFVLLMWGSAY